MQFTDTRDFRNAADRFARGVRQLNFVFAEIIRG